LGLRLPGWVRVPSAEAKVREAKRDGTAGIGLVREGASMNRFGLLIVLVFPLSLLASGFAVAPTIRR